MRRGLPPDVLAPPSASAATGRDDRTAYVRVTWLFRQTPQDPQETRRPPGPNRGVFSGSGGSDGSGDAGVGEQPRPLGVMDDHPGVPTSQVVPVPVVQLGELLGQQP